MRNPLIVALLALALFSCAQTPAYAADAPPPQPNATAQVINHVIDKASDGLTQIAHTLSNAAPQAFALAVKGVYAKGASSLVVGAFCLAAFLFFLIACLTGIVLCIRAEQKDSDSGVPWLFLIVPSGILAIIFMCVACNFGLDSSSWAMVLSPDGYLAQQILTKALN